MEHSLNLKILKNIKQAVPSWTLIKDVLDISVKKLCGLSNSVYRVGFISNDSYEGQTVEPSVLLYREFEC
jgi:hypothetical protein